VFRTARITQFVLIALASLVLGGVGAATLGELIHRRYDRTNTGYYHGYIQANLFGTDDANYRFSFTGRSKPRWQWFSSTSIVYDSLQFEFVRYDDHKGPIEGKGTIHLPSLNYSSSIGTGTLTRATLAGWLIAGAGTSSKAKQGVDGIFDFIEAAGRGTLPGPQHHTRYFTQPVGGKMSHFSRGAGVSDFVYGWIACWAVLVPLAWRWFKNSCQNACPETDDSNLE
jgi:hypothetical protein